MAESMNAYKLDTGASRCLHPCMDTVNVVFTSGITYIPPPPTGLVLVVHHYIHKIRREDPCVKLICMHEICMPNTRTYE